MFLSEPGAASDTATVALDEATSVFLLKLVTVVEAELLVWINITERKEPDPVEALGIDCSNGNLDQVWVTRVVDVLRYVPLVRWIHSEHKIIWNVVRIEVEKIRFVIGVVLHSHYFCNNRVADNGPKVLTNKRTSWNELHRANTPAALRFRSSDHQLNTGAVLKDPIPTVQGVALALSIALDYKRTVAAIQLIKVDSPIWKVRHGLAPVLLLLLFDHRYVAAVAVA